MQDALSEFEGTIYTINDQNKVLTITQQLFRACTLHKLFPIEIIHLIISYSICPLHYAEFSLIRDDQQIPAISTLTDKKKIKKQALLKKLQALSVILTQQKSYLNRFNDNSHNSYENIKRITENIKQYQSELYDKCRLIKENMIKDIISAANDNQITLDIEIYDAMINCIFTNLSIQFQTSQGFCSNSLENETKYDWEQLANGREDVLHENLLNMKKERKSNFALQILELWHWIYNNDVNKLNKKLLNHIKEKLDTNKDINLLITFCGKFNYAEIDAMKCILHRIYEKCIFLRHRIRIKMLSQIQTFIYCPYLVNGRDINEIVAYGNNGIDENEENENFSYAINTFLELIWCIISGLNVPIKYKWINELLIKVLLPLHKVDDNRFIEYSDWLYYDINTFCCKDILLIGPIILNYLIKYWPFRSVSKMRIFTHEFHFIFEYFIQFEMSQHSKSNKRNYDRTQKEMEKLSDNLLNLAKESLYKLFIPMSDSLSMELRELSYTFWNNETIIALLNKFSEKDRNDILHKIKHIPKIENTNTTSNFPVPLPPISENDTDI